MLFASNLAQWRTVFGSRKVNRRVLRVAQVHGRFTADQARLRRILFCFKTLVLRLSQIQRKPTLAPSQEISISRRLLPESLGSVLCLLGMAERGLSYPPAYFPQRGKSGGSKGGATPLSGS